MIEIRKASKKDLPAILKLYAQRAMSNGHVLSLKAARKIFSQIGKYPDYKFFIAAQNGRVIGTFGLLIMHRLAHEGKGAGILADVAVDPTCQGKGVGKEMMRFAMQKCKEGGAYKLALSSNSKRKMAHQFYEKLGFKRHGYSFSVDLK